MAVDFMDEKLYSIDYDGWLRGVWGLPIVDRQDLKSKYFSGWIFKLKSVEEESEVQFFRHPSLDMLAEEFKHPERFQFPMFYYNTTVYVHFNVSAINDELQTTDGIKDDIPIEAFTDRSSSIEWTKPEGIVQPKNAPILLAPMVIGERTQMIVIDGNHRVDNAIRSNTKFIQGIRLDPQELVDRNWFCSDFDKYAYIFQNETIALAMKKRFNSMSDEDILSLSYLTSGKVNVALRI